MLDDKDTLPLLPAKDPVVDSSRSSKRVSPLKLLIITSTVAIAILFVVLAFHERQLIDVLQENAYDSSIEDTDSDVMVNTPLKDLKEGGETAGEQEQDTVHKPARPNIIFVLTDDMGYNDIGYLSTDLSDMTPFIDALAADGIKIGNYYSMSLCSPARAALLTGRYPLRYGLQDEIIQVYAPYGLPLDEVLMPELLQDAGYQTHLAGKWHLGHHDEPYMPYNRGFDSFMGILHGGGDYWTHVTTVDETDFYDIGYGDKVGAYLDPVTNQPRNCSVYANKYSTQLYEERAIEIMQAHKASGTTEPLFLYLAHQATHFPISEPPPDEMTDIMDTILAKDVVDQRKQFAMVVNYLDKSMQRLVQAMQQMGYDQNTLLVFASDNGGCQDYGGCNYPLRGLKHTHFEGGNRVPAFIWSASPNIIPNQLRGKTYGNMFHVTDWLPTLFSFAGISTDGQPNTIASAAAAMSVDPEQEVSARSRPLPVFISSEIDEEDDNTENVQRAEGPSSAAKSRALDGVDHWDALMMRTEVVPREELVYNWNSYYQYDEHQTGVSSLKEHPPRGAIRVGRWKLLIEEWCHGFFSFSRTDDFKTHMCDEVGMRVCTGCSETCEDHADNASISTFLFDLDEDPTEEVNLIDKYPDVAAWLHNRWMELSADHAEPLSLIFGDVNEEVIFANAKLAWAKHGNYVVPWLGASAAAAVKEEN